MCLAFVFFSVLTQWAIGKCKRGEVYKSRRLRRSPVFVWWILRGREAQQLKRRRRFSFFFYIFLHERCLVCCCCRDDATDRTTTFPRPSYANEVVSLRFSFVPFSFFFFSSPFFFKFLARNFMSNRKYFFFSLFQVKIWILTHQLSENILN